MSDLQREVVKAQYAAINMVFFNGEDLPNQTINSFPETWEKFFVGKTDLIKGVHHRLAKDAVSCLYVTQETGSFGKHKHDSADEYIFVVSGRVIVHTPYGKAILERGDSFKIPAGLGHYCDFEEAAEIMITWLGELSFDYDPSYDEMPLDCKRNLLATLRERQSAMVQNGDVDDDALNQILEEIKAKENTPCSLYKGCHEECEFFTT